MCDRLIALIATRPTAKAVPSQGRGSRMRPSNGSSTPSRD
jgi:hypothetical protein